MQTLRGSRLVAALLAGAVFVVAGCAPPVELDGPAAAEIAVVVRARLDAAGQGSTAGWARFVADDCICGLETKAAIEKAMASRPPGVKSWFGEVRDLRIRRSAGAVVARYRVTEHTEVGGQRTSLEVWRTETFERQAGAWILVAGADTVLEPEPTAMQLDRGLLASYQGRYEYTPGAVDVVSLEGDRLFVQSTGEARVELFAESASSFFVQGEPGRLVFVRTPQGAVDALVFRSQGQEWRARKVD